MLYWIWVVVIGLFFGLTAGFITQSEKNSFWIITLISGLLGSALGEAFLGTWGWQVDGLAIFPSIIGAAGFTIIAIVLITLNKKKKFLK